MPGNYDTYELVGLIEQRKKPLPWFLRRYFPEVMESDREEVFFDDVIRERRMAPFVSPMAEGKVMRSQGSTMRSFRPAYVKPKHIIRPDEPLKRLPGEGFGGQLSPAQRMEYLKAQRLLEQSEMIDNRIEWMAVQALKTGSVIVAGDDYPERVVDYGRDASLAVALTTNARWNDSAPDPMKDIEGMSTAMSKADFGAPARDIIMDPDAWGALQDDTQLRELMDKNFAGNATIVDRAPQTFDPNDDPMPVGSIGGGRFTLYVDARQYEDESGSVVPYLDSGDVIFATPAIQGVQTFGAILDAEVLLAMRAYPKTWLKEDPSVWIAMTQSAPLPIPARINASGYLKAF